MEESNGSASEISEDNCYVALTHDHLNAQEIMDKVRSPAAGAIVLFAGLLSQCTPTEISADPW
jgi:molybdopterin synthase catalytic subunit